MKPKYLNNQDPWMLGEEIPDMDFFFSQIWQSCFTHEFKNPSGRAYSKLLCVWRGYHLWYYFGEKDSNLVANTIVSKFVSKPLFAVQVNKQIIKEADKIRVFAKSLPEKNLSSFSNRQLWDLYNRHDAVHTAYYQWCWIPVACDMFHSNFTDYLKNVLRRLAVSEKNINQFFSLLTQPTKKSLIQIEQEEFLQIAAKIQAVRHQEKIFKNLFKVFEEQEVTQYGLATHTPEYESKLELRAITLIENIRPDILRLIKRHYEKYFYVKTLWNTKEKPYTLEYYIKELVKFIGRGGNAKKMLKEKYNEQKKLSLDRKRLIKKIKIKNIDLTLFTAFGDFMVTKIYRRYAQIYAIYRMQPILREIARRFGITMIQVSFMLKKEIKSALLTGKINKKELAERVNFCVYYTERDLEEVYIGNKAKILFKQVNDLRENFGNVEKIKGQIGCMGKARGKVKIIIRPEDMSKMKRGDVLVSIATDPDIVPAMKRAAAIVTEQGGVTSHAAIVSRELGIPCVIGTKIATKVFKDGDMVEVDADNGIVKRIK